MIIQLGFDFVGNPGLSSNFPQSLARIQVKSVEHDLVGGEWPSSNSMIQVNLWKEVELHRWLLVATNTAATPTVPASCPRISFSPAHRADAASLLRPIGQPQGDPMTEKGLSCPDKVGTQEVAVYTIYSYLFIQHIF